MTKKAIGLAQYMELSRENQFDILHRDGVYIGKRKTREMTVILFQLYSFYVEIFYKQYRREVDYIMASDSADILSPYIDQVEVRDLNKGGKKQ